MSKKVFKNERKSPINEQLDNLEYFQQKVKDAIAEKKDVIKKIRKGFINAVVVFIDMVDSTKFKIENENEPEKWILRVKQFGDIIKEYIEKNNGRVVKYIGDEVMGIFNSETQIDDALALIGRIKNIEKNLTEITEAKTKIKIALDYGPVYLIKYNGHEELDPQGTPIDRCARIGKYCEPSTILSSYNFVSKTSFPKQWIKIGSIEMKGLGVQPIYQYGEQTIELKKIIEINEEFLNKLKNENKTIKDENENLYLDNNEYISTINKLQEQIKQIGNKPIINTDFTQKTENKQKEKDWNEINKNIKSIKKLISDSGVNETDYARFIFLYMKGSDEEYNSFKDKTFDDLIEKGIVFQNSDERFELNTDNKRNQRILDLINKTQNIINRFIEDYGVIDEKDLFEYSFEDADFWENYLDYYVVK